jgi:uncharacterized protein DUF5681
MSEKKKDYEVGFGKPPKSGQFKKGQSGNRKGRPKGARGLKTDLKAELSEMVTFTENGRQRNLSKQRLMIKQLAAKAVKGDLRAISKLAGLAIGVLGVEDEPAKGPASLSMSKQAILDDYIKRKTRGGPSDDS